MAGDRLTAAGVALGGRCPTIIARYRATSSGCDCANAGVNQRPTTASATTSGEPAARTAAARSRHADARRQVRRGAEQDQPVDPLGRVDGQPLADHAADRQPAVGRRAVSSRRSSMASTSVPRSSIAYGPVGTGEPPWPRWSKRITRCAAESAGTCGSHMASVVPSEPPSSRTGASVGPAGRAVEVAPGSRPMGRQRAVDQLGPAPSSTGWLPGRAPPAEVRAHPLRVARCRFSSSSRDQAVAEPIRPSSSV